MNIPEMQQRLYEKLIPGGWGNVLKGFMLSSEMGVLLQHLVDLSDEGKKWTPKLSQVFRAFEECPYDKLKLVLVLQDPYPTLLEGVNVADGIAMSCSNTKKIQPSLAYVHQEIATTLYEGAKYNWKTDLAPWSNQGILMLNIALTTTIGKSGTHYEIWKPFIIYLMDMLNWNNGGLIWLFMGNKAQEYMRVLNDNCYKLKCTHPASAAYQNLDTWDSGGVFVKINQILKKNGKEEINWK